MNKKFLFTLLIVTLTLAGCAQKNESTNNPPTPTINKDVKEVTTPIKGRIEEVNEEWNKYTNTELGFSIQYPKNNFVFDDGRQNTYKVDIIEDDNVVYLTDGRNPEKGNSDFEKAKSVPFAILIQSVSSDEELENFIKERYGENCKLGEKRESNKEGIFNVNIDGLGTPDDPESCVVNYITTIKYAPEKGKAASWDIGQDGVFYKEDTTGIDAQISDSFEFL